VSDFFLNTKPYLEWGSLLSTIVLCFVVIYGLKQIRLLKIDILSRSERSAKEKAIEAIGVFLNQFMPSYVKLMSSWIEKKMDTYEGQIGKFDPKEFETAEKKGIQDNAFRKMLSSVWLDSFYQLEAIAASFISGVADEKTGFDVIGHHFVNSVQKNYDIYTVTQHSVAKGKIMFPNTIELFKVWNPRFTAKELELTKKAIDSQLQSLEIRSIPSLAPQI
jgi:hypothetical protein